MELELTTTVAAVEFTVVSGTANIASAATADDSKAANSRAALRKAGASATSATPATRCGGPKACRRGKALSGHGRRDLLGKWRGRKKYSELNSF